MIGFKSCFLLRGGGISLQKNRAGLFKREWVWNWSPGKLAGLVWPTPSFCYNLSVTIPFYFTHHMCVGVPTRWEAYPLFSVLIIHVCIHEGKSMNSPFYFLSTDVCVSQNLLGSETLVSMCVLFVLPVICLQLDGIKARKNNFFEKLELDLLGDLCSMKHYAGACPSLMEATLLKGWR